MFHGVISKFEREFMQPSSVRWGYWYIYPRYTHYMFITKLM